MSHCAGCLPEIPKTENNDYTINKIFSFSLGQLDDNYCVTYLTHFLAGMNRIEICELGKVFQLMVACTPHINISTSHWNELLRTFC